MNTSSNSIPNKNDFGSLQQHNVPAANRATVPAESGAMDDMGIIGTGASMNISTAMGAGLGDNFNDSEDFGLLSQMKESVAGPSL